MLTIAVPSIRPLSLCVTHTNHVSSPGVLSRAAPRDIRPERVLRGGTSLSLRQRAFCRPSDGVIPKPLHRSASASSLVSTGTSGMYATWALASMIAPFFQILPRTTFCFRRYAMASGAMQIPREEGMLTATCEQKVAQLKLHKTLVDHITDLFQQKEKSILDTQ